MVAERAAARVAAVVSLFDLSFFVRRKFPVLSRLLVSLRARPPAAWRGRAEQSGRGAGIVLRARCGEVRCWSLLPTHFRHHTILLSHTISPFNFHTDR